MRDAPCRIVVSAVLVSVLSGCGGSKDAEATSGPDGKSAATTKTLVPEKPPVVEATPGAPKSAGTVAAVTRDEARRQELARKIGDALDKATDSFDRAEHLSRAREVGPAAKPLWPRIVAALKDPEGMTRASAVAALAAIDPAACRPHLEQALKDKETEVREAAAEAWNAAGIKDVGPLLQALDVEVDQKVQLAAMLAIEKLADAGLAPAVAKAMGGVDPMAARPAVRFLVAKKAVAEGERIADLVNWHDAELRELASKALGELGVKGKPALLALTRALSDDVPQVRKAAYASLKSLTGQSFEFDPDAKDPSEAGIRLWKEWIEKGG